MAMDLDPRLQHKHHQQAHKPDMVLWKESLKVSNSLIINPQVLVLFHTNYLKYWLKFAIMCCYHLHFFISLTLELGLKIKFLVMHR